MMTQTEFYIQWFPFLLSQESSNYGSQAKSGPPVCANKVLLEHRHAGLFTYCRGCFCATTAETIGHNTDSTAHKAKNLYSLAF